MPSHRKSRLSAARKQARTITLCAATIGAAAMPALASAATSVNTASSSHAASAPAPAHVAKHAAPQAAPQAAPVAVRTVASAASETVAANTYTVQAGDTLYAIAARSLGSGKKYHEIFKLNKNHVENDGSRFTNANLIQIGWQITLPSGAGSAAAPVQSTTTTPVAPAASSSSSSSDSSSSSSSSSDSSSSSSSSSSVSSSGYADDLDGWINQAIAILGQNGYSVSYNAIYETAENESGGDANAVNGWDSNAAAGTPSIGLMQVIQPTFDAYALPGYDDIYNPVDNIIAAAIYAQDTYGGLDNVVAARCGGSCWSGY